MSEFPSQPILTNLGTCRDHISDSEAAEYGIDDRHYCDCMNCFTPGTRADYAVRLRQVGTLDFPVITEFPAIPKIPELIPSHRFDRRRPPDGSAFGAAVAVKYWEVGGLHSLDPGRARNFRRKHRLNRKQLLVLHGEGKDDDLERLYVRACKSEFFHACTKLGSVLLVAPGYSLYSDGTQCRLWQPYNLRRSMLFAEEAWKRGIPCVPYIASNHSRDTERMCDWLNKQQTAVTHLAVNWQTNGRSALAENLQFAAEVENRTHRIIHWLIFGPSAERVVRQIGSTLRGPLTFVTAKPIQRAFASRKQTSGERPGTATEEDLIRSFLNEHRRAIRRALAARKR